MELTDRVQHLGKGDSSTYATDIAKITVTCLPAGWNYKENLAPIIGTRYCKQRHIGYCSRGIMEFTFPQRENKKTLVKKGDVYDIHGDHVAKVVGEEDCILVDFTCISCIGREAAKEYTAFSESGCCDL